MKCKRNRVFCVAVGGPTQDRYLRANAAKIFFPNLEHLFLKSTLPNPNSFPLATNNFLVKLLDYKRNEVKGIEKFQFEKCDTLIVIGNLGFPPAASRTLEALRGIFKGCRLSKIWIQGPA